MPYAKRYTEDGIDAVLFDTQGLTLYPGGVMIPKGARAVKAGSILARNISTKEFVVCKYWKGAVPNSTTIAMGVDGAHPFEVGDSLKVGTQTAQNIVSIDYSTGDVTVGTAWTAGTGQDVKVETNKQDKPVGIALVPVMDSKAYLGGAHLVAPIEGDSELGALAITGRFRYDRIKGIGQGWQVLDDLGGKYNDDIGPGGVLIITTPNQFNLT